MIRGVHNGKELLPSLFCCPGSGDRALFWGRRFCSNFCGCFVLPTGHHGNLSSSSCFLEEVFCGRCTGTEIINLSKSASSKLTILGVCSSRLICGRLRFRGKLEDNWWPMNRTKGLGQLAAFEAYLKESLSFRICCFPVNKILVIPTFLLCQ